MPLGTGGGYRWATSKAFVAGALGMGELEKAESVLLATLPGGRRGEVGDLGGVILSLEWIY